MQASLAEMRFVSYLNLDLNKCNPRRIADKDTILDFSQQACDLLETTPIKEMPTAVRFGLGSHAEGFSLVLVTSMRDVLVAHFAELTHSAYVDWKWMSYRLRPVVQQQVEDMRSLPKKLFGAKALVVVSERYCDNPKVVVRDTNKYGVVLEKS